MTGCLKLGVAGLTALALPLYANAEPLKSCTNASWEGNYGFKLVGERIGGADPGPRAGVGRVISDGHGNISGTETKSSNGTIVQGLTFSGNYTILTDCTGSGSVMLSDGEMRHFNFVVVEQGEEVIAIQTDPGRVTTITATKQTAR
jgi:hypothetical protein